MGKGLSMDQLAAKFADREIRIFLDIDESLAIHLEDSISLSEKWCDILRKNGLEIFASQFHFILPGVKEFLALMDTLPNVKLAFFSSGDPHRNQVFVRELFKLTFGDTYKEKIKKIKIYSTMTKSDHAILKRTEKKIDRDREQYNTFNIETWSQRKKLPVTQTELEWTVMIDDQLPNAYYGQERNLLKISECREKHFSKMYECFYDAKHQMCNESFIAINHIFFMTGLLFAALEKAVLENKTMATVLFNMQYTAKYEMSKSALKLFYNQELSNNKFYMSKGLKLLSKFNSELKLIDNQYFFGAEQRETSLHRDFSSHLRLGNCFRSK